MSLWEMLSITALVAVGAWGHGYGFAIRGQLKWMRGHVELLRRVSGVQDELIAAQDEIIRDQDKGTQ